MKIVICFLLEMGVGRNYDDRKVCEVLLIILLKYCYEYHHTVAYTVIYLPIHLGNEGFDIENNHLKY